jgi:large subunit ribosomal protein L9
VEVILLDRISKLGELGEKVRVKAGFGRNYLIPQGKALPATKSNLEVFEARRKELEKTANERLAQAKQRALALNGLKISITANAGEEGRLFGSVGIHEVVQAAKELGYTIAKSEIQLPEGPFRQLGEYEVELYLHGDDVIAKIQVSVVS